MVSWLAGKPSSLSTSLLGTCTSFLNSEGFAELGAKCLQNVLAVSSQLAEEAAAGGGDAGSGTDYDGNCTIYHYDGNCTIYQ